MATERDDMTAVKRDFTGTLDVAEGGIKPLPADVGDDIITDDKGPCFASEHYYVLMTNQIGELQVHPCSKPFYGLDFGCGAAFLYSPTYGWVKVKKTTQLWERLEALRLLVLGASPTKN